MCIICILATTLQMASLEQIQKLREQTSASMSDVKKALDESQGDEEKALKILKERGKVIAEKKSQREAADGLIFSYIHPNATIGVLLKLNGETYFVAKTEEFNAVGKNRCMHIAALNTENTEELLKQPFIKDQEKIVSDLITEVIAKVGENITVNEFIRYEI